MKEILWEYSGLCASCLRFAFRASAALSPAVLLERPLGVLCQDGVVDPHRCAVAHTHIHNVCGQHDNTTVGPEVDLHAEHDITLGRDHQRGVEVDGPDRDVGVRVVLPVRLDDVLDEDPVLVIELHRPAGGCLRHHPTDLRISVELESVQMNCILLCWAWSNRDEQDGGLSPDTRGAGASFCTYGTSVTTVCTGSRSIYSNSDRRVSVIRPAGGRPMRHRMRGAANPVTSIGPRARRRRASVRTAESSQWSESRLDPLTNQW